MTEQNQQVSSPESTSPLTCPGCQRTFKNEGGLAAHKRFCKELKETTPAKVEKPVPGEKMGSQEKPSIQHGPEVPDQNLPKSQVTPVGASKPNVNVTPAKLTEQPSNNEMPEDSEPAENIGGEEEEPETQPNENGESLEPLPGSSSITLTPVEEEVWEKLTKDVTRKRCYKTVVGQAQNTFFKPILSWYGRDATVNALTDETLRLVHDRNAFETFFLPVIRLVSGGETGHVKGACTLAVRLAFMMATIGFAGTLEDLLD